MYKSIKINKKGFSPRSNSVLVESIKSSEIKVGDIIIIEENKINHVLIFTRTKHGADKVAKALNALRNRTTTDASGNAVTALIKNIKAKSLPTNLRAKNTRALRRALTKSQAKKVNIRILKRKLNFPLRKFAVPLSK